MKIVALLGSPRLKGNSAYITEQFLEEAARLGAETKSFALNTLAYRGCQACMGCKKASETCTVHDGLTEVLDAVRESDVVVLASPVYYGDVTGQLKLFIDRMYSFLKPDFHTNPDRSRLAPGKRVVFVQTQGQAEPEFFADVYPRYRQMLIFNGFADTELIRACGLSKPGDAMKREDVLGKARALAAAIVQGAAA